MISESAFTSACSDIAVFYGMSGRLPRVMKDYKKSGATAVYIDLGYWGRRDGGRLAGYHKVSVNDRHPTAYFQSVRHPTDRLSKFRIKIKPWRRSGKQILIAGMSGKGAISQKFQPGEWESLAVEDIKRYSKRPIIFRPKPSCRYGIKIPGCPVSPADQRIVDALHNCHAVVTHHSNAAVDAILEGIPAFAIRGVATPLALDDLSKIEEPLYPDGREQWAADIAYCQWNLNEMATGQVWRHLKSEGLIP